MTGDEQIAWDFMLRGSSVANGEMLGAVTNLQICVADLTDQVERIANAQHLTAPLWKGPSWARLILPRRWIG